MAVDKYARLLRDHPVESLCWTVVQPVSQQVGIAEVVRRLGGDPASLVPRPVEAAYSTDRPVIHIGASGSADKAGAVTLFELNGYQGSRPELLRWLSDGARVHSVHWSVNGSSTFHYAVYGRVLTRLNGDLPDSRSGVQPDALDADLADLGRDGLDLAGDPRAAMLALAERRTGVELRPDWFTGVHEAVEIEPVRADPVPPGLFAAQDPDLDSLLRSVADHHRNDAIRVLISRLAVEFDLLDEPSVGVVLDHLKMGFPKDELPSEAMAPLLHTLQTGYDQPGWHRMQAAIAISLSARPAHLSHHPADAMLHAKYALAEEWPEMRATIWRVARGSLHRSDGSVA